MAEQIQYLNTSSSMKLEKRERISKQTRKQSQNIGLITFKLKKKNPNYQENKRVLR